MPAITVPLPARIGEAVQVIAGELSGQEALVIGWRLTRPRFTLGCALDGPPQLAIQVLAAHGEAHWLQDAEVAGLGESAPVSVTLPFMAGDEVIICSSRATGEIRGWEIIGSWLATNLRYRVHLTGTPRWDEIEVDARNLEPRTRS